MPESMSSLPMFVQRNWDYMAPEYPISSTITPPADMYSLGCILYAVHNKGVPPFRNHGSLGTLRSNIESLERRGLGGMEAWDADLRGNSSIFYPAFIEPTLLRSATTADHAKSTSSDPRNHQHPFLF